MRTGRPLSREHEREHASAVCKWATARFSESALLPDWLVGSRKRRSRGALGLPVGAPEKPVYVSKDSKGELIVLSAVCTHLGCTVPWVEKEKKFICPCHLGVFAPDGKLLGGPPPRDMDRLETKVENGVLKTQYQFFRQLTRNKEELA